MKAVINFKTNWWVSFQHVFSESFFFFFNILMGSWWEQVGQGVGYGKVFHCYLEKEQFRKNGYDVIYMKICTFEIYKKNRTNTS